MSAEEGQLVRVLFTGDSSPTEGILVRSQIGWALTIADGQSRVLDPAELDRLETPQRHRSPWKGAAIGGGIGLGVGLFMAALGTVECSNNDLLGICSTVNDASAVVELVGVPVAGALVGGLVGSLIGSTRWAPAIAPTGTPGRQFGMRFGWSIPVR